MRNTSLRPWILEVFRATTRVAGLIWKTRANQFVFLLAPRGRWGRGFCLLCFVGEDGGFAVIVTVGLASAFSVSGDDQSTKR